MDYHKVLQLKRLYVIFDVSAHIDKAESIAKFTGKFRPYVSMPRRFEHRVVFDKLKGVFSCESQQLEIVDNIGYF